MTTPSDRNARSTLLACLALLSVHCGGRGANDAGDAASIDADAAPADAPPDVEPPPPMMCRPGTPWTTDRAAFRSDDTAGWGLAEARGTGLAVADLDNDGYPDLLTWDAAPNARSTFDTMPPVVHLRVYMNQQRSSGMGRTFVEMTRHSNLLAIRGGGVGRVAQFAVFADVDNDGDVDAYTGVMPNPRPPMGTPADPGDRSTILLNDGHGVFALGPQSDVTPPDTDAPQTIGAVFLDQNLDGQIDLFVGYHSDTFGLPVGQQPQLFRGAGDGAFTDVTDEVGIGLGEDMASITSMTNRRPLYGISACDVNNDGRLDLIGASYARQSNLLFASDGARFRDVSVASTMGADTNLDYSDNLSYRCYCAGAAGRCPPTVPAPPATGYCPGRGWRPGIDDQPWRLGGNTFSIACGDVDNDGDVDLYNADIAHPDVGGSSDRAEMLINESDATNTRFRRPGRMAMGLVPNMPRTVDEGGISNGLWDFDNDGRMDVWFGPSDYDQQWSSLFQQQSDGRFLEVGRSAGFRHACAHGLAVADFDLDGDLDVIVGSSTFRSWCNMQWMGQNVVRVYENIASEANWTAVRLVGRGRGGANRSAIGARVRVTAGGVTQMRDIQNAWGVTGLQTELVAHFGLGTNCMIDRIEVRWPDGSLSTESFQDVRANYRLEIRQGEGFVRYLR